MPSSFDHVGWQLAHTAKLNTVHAELEAEGLTVSLERQNAFTLKGRAIAIGGKPDLIARSTEGAIVLDVKTGKPSASHAVQVMAYMYAVPRALPEYRGLPLDGRLVYTDHEVEIPASAIDSVFVDSLTSLLRRLGAADPARKVPSTAECGFCPITQSDCPERRVHQEDVPGETEDF
ncbi:MAG: PD-(D/E)XK nuclease superfamily protein [Chloroflexi bacterium]|nr:MAG: PD-(D/E)XK nuclease superfamily protein [Chloroflexota bacterium]